ncbi:unnamed protein product, partial [Polarella glacialis]
MSSLGNEQAFQQLYPASDAPEVVEVNLTTIQESKSEAPGTTWENCCKHSQESSQDQVRQLGGDEMDPSQTELDQWRASPTTSLQSGIAGCGMSANTLNADGAVASAAIAARYRNTLDLGQVGSLIRCCRLRKELPAEEAQAGPITQASNNQGNRRPAASGSPPVADSPSRRVKMSTGICQAGDTEVHAMNSSQARTIIKTVAVQSDGIAPDSDEECYATQLQALKTKLDMDIGHYAGFAIWRPYGFRMARRNEVQNSGLETRERTIHRRRDGGASEPRRMEDVLESAQLCHERFGGVVAHQANESTPAYGEEPTRGLTRSRWRDYDEILFDEVTAVLVIDGVLFVQILAVLGMKGFLFVELLAVLGNCGGVLFDELLAVLVSDGVLVVASMSEPCWQQALTSNQRSNGRNQPDDLAVQEPSFRGTWKTADRHQPPAAGPAWENCTRALKTPKKERKTKARDVHCCDEANNNFTGVCSQTDTWYDKLKPLDAVLLYASQDRDFWDSEVKRKPCPRHECHHEAGDEGETGGKMMQRAKKGQAVKTPQRVEQGKDGKGDAGKNWQNECTPAPKSADEGWQATDLQRHSSRNRRPAHYGWTKEGEGGLSLQLRSRNFLLGLPKLTVQDKEKVETSAVISKHATSWCKALHQAGLTFIIDNPGSSYLWMLEDYLELAKLPGVRSVDSRNYRHGGDRRKPPNSGCAHADAEKTRGESERSSKGDVIEARHDSGIQDRHFVRSGESRVEYTFSEIPQKRRTMRSGGGLKDPRSSRKLRTEGGNLARTDQVDGLDGENFSVEIPEEYAREMREEAEDLSNRKAADVNKTQKFVGKGSWTSGRVPILGTMLSKLWAAVKDVNNSEGIDGGNEGLIPIVRIAHALAWPREFFKEENKEKYLKRQYYVSLHRWSIRVRIAADASQWGFGTERLGSPGHFELFQDVGIHWGQGENEAWQNATMVDLVTVHLPAVFNDWTDALEVCEDDRKYPVPRQLAKLPRTPDNLWWLRSAIVMHEKVQRVEIELGATNADTRGNSYSRGMACTRLNSPVPVCTFHGIDSGVRMRLTEEATGDRPIFPNNADTGDNGYSSVIAGTCLDSPVPLCTSHDVDSGVRMRLTEEATGDRPIFPTGSGKFPSAADTIETWTKVLDGLTDKDTAGRAAKIGSSVPHQEEVSHVLSVIIVPHASASSRQLDPIVGQEALDLQSVKLELPEFYSTFAVGSELRADRVRDSSAPGKTAVLKLNGLELKVFAEEAEREKPQRVCWPGDDPFSYNLDIGCTRKVSSGCPYLQPDEWLTGGGLAWDDRNSRSLLKLAGEPCAREDCILAKFRGVGSENDLASAFQQLYPVAFWPFYSHLRKFCEADFPDLIKKKTPWLLVRRSPPPLRPARHTPPPGPTLVQLGGELREIRPIVAEGVAGGFRSPCFRCMCSLPAHTWPQRKLLTSETTEVDYSQRALEVLGIPPPPTGLGEAILSQPWKLKQSRLLDPSPNSAAQPTSWMFDTLVKGKPAGHNSPKVYGHTPTTAYSVSRMVSRALAAACRDLEELLRPRHAGAAAAEDSAEDVLPEVLRELAHNEPAWEGLDEAELVTSGPLLLGSNGLLELVQAGGLDKAPGFVAYRRHALDACALFLHIHGQSASSLLQRRLKWITASCLHIFKNDVANPVCASALHVLLRALEVPGVSPPPTGLGEDLLRELKLRHSRLTAGQHALLLRTLAALADLQAASTTTAAAATTTGATTGGATTTTTTGATTGATTTAAATAGEGFAGELRTRLLGTLERESSSVKPVLELLAGVLKSLSVLLRRHAHLFGAAEMQRIYENVTVIALEQEAATSRLGPRRAAMRLLQDHASLFRGSFATEALKSLSDTAARKPGEALPADEGSLLCRLLAATEAAQPDVAEEGRGMLDAVLRALNDGALSSRPVVGDVVMGAASGSAADDPASRKRPREEAADELEVQSPPPEAAVVRGWYPHFRAMVLCPGGSQRLIGTRSLGALAPSVAKFDGAAVVLDFLEVVLEAAEAAMGPKIEEEEEAEGGVTVGSVATALPEFAEALARTIPAVRRWLTGAQWARLLAVGVQLLRAFSRAFTKRRPKVARACASFLAALRSDASEEHRDAGANFAPYETLVAQGVVLMVTERDLELSALWELVLSLLEREDRIEELQPLVDSLVSSALSLARQGVDNYLRLRQQEERGELRMADFVAKAQSRGSLAMGAATVAASPSMSQDIQQVVAEADPTFAVHAAYVFEQAAETTQFLQRLAAFMDRAFGSTALPSRRGLLRPWADAVLAAVAELLALCRSAGESPPPGVFRLLRVALGCCSSTAALGGQAILRLPPGFLEETAGALEGYQGTVALEALEALLAVPPAWVSARKWQPVFQRALSEGLHDPGLLHHALGELE